MQPVVVLNKADLSDNPKQCLAQAQAAAGEAPVLLASAITGQGIDQLRQFIRPAHTAVFLGPSGVGKSSLINRLYGEEIQATIEVRESDAKGRHTTTWRELIQMPDGGLVIDTPGMREFQVWLAEESGPPAFPDLDEMAVRCHFRDCTHTVEKRCAVKEALERGEVDRGRYDSYLKLRHDLEYIAEERQKHTYLARQRATKVAKQKVEEARYRRLAAGDESH